MPIIKNYTEKCTQCEKDCHIADMFILSNPVEESTQRVVELFCSQTCIANRFGKMEDKK